MPRGPLADRYPGAVALVLLALTPYLVLTTALQPLQQLISADLHLSAHALQLTDAMSNAAYAAGTVLAVQLGSRLPARRPLVVYAALFVVGSVLAAWAPVPGLFIAGHILQGLTTSLMLIAAAPALVTGWGADKLPRTAVIMNLGIFGAAALGPVIGGASAGTGTWRPFFWIVAALGAGALVMSLLTYEDVEPQDPDAPVDIVALVCAAGGCAAAFFGVAELSNHSGTAFLVLAPLIAGVALLALLVAHEWRTEDPLIPIRALAHTIPVAAIVTAMAAGAASIALVELAEQALKVKGASPTHAGMLFWPEFGAALATAFAFGRLIRTRWIAVYAATGMALIAGGAGVLTGAARGSDWLVLVGAALVGFGEGASVSPALFLAGFSLRSPQLPRVFAFVELLRGVAAFLTAPVILKIAVTTARPPAVGLRTGVWIAGGIAALGLLAACTVWRLGRVRLAEPDIEAWMDGDAPAIPSSPVAASLRSG